MEKGGGTDAPDAARGKLLTEVTTSCSECRNNLLMCLDSMEEVPLKN